jgi:hypothetical protein
MLGGPGERLADRRDESSTGKSAQELRQGTSSRAPATERVDDVDGGVPLGR